ncbi:DUF222 domain-containing protein [Frankia sp. AiPs1]|uniref:hypothetical protein n=1 Tax=Frankia sp. AiPa1 TaxID=573492 RepID=UPI00202B6187|nr:hypothetical protein [Frankia sp. AiPa1]MCL9758095.1 hypothetical protein [Frankia sp. AiPa1]
MTSIEPAESDLVQAFRRIDEQRARDPEAVNLVAFRERLLGELVGDADRVAAALAPGFTLVTHAGGKTQTSSGDQVVSGVRRLGAVPGGALMWLRLDDLVADRTTIAGHGSLVTLAAAPTGGLHRTVAPLAFFIVSETTDAGSVMTSESLYLNPGAQETAVLADAALLDRQRCLDLVGNLSRPAS